MLHILGSFSLQPLKNDLFHWRWHKSGLFSVHSFYEWLDFGGVINTEFVVIWKSKIPLKIKIFMSLLRRTRLLTKDQLLKRGWIGDSKCVFCDQDENADHLFVYCPTVRTLWQWIAQFNNFTFQDCLLANLWLIDSCIPLKDKILVELVRSVVCWVIWLERNSIIFNQSSPVSYRALGLKIINLATF
jgi:zinc-binding in reverse transcriptase